MANAAKTAIVTGASRGIGAGLVEAFLKRGYSVVANSRNITKANPFAAAFVDALATRIASFDKRAISETKRFADVASLPPDFEIAPEWDVCFAAIMRPAAQEKIKRLMELGFHKPGDVEERLGYYVGQLGRSASEEGRT